MIIESNFDCKWGFGVLGEIVKSVSGQAMPGQCTYIMGSSGAGKTSLLNLISDRVKRGLNVKISGKVTINDKMDLNQALFGKIGAYVMQDDVLFSYFTPREALRFAARMKVRGDLDDQEFRVNRLLKELGLTHCADVIIGSLKNKTISGGERKRTAIGVELITDPSLLLLDEPTSGLDSFKALQIVRLLNKQAKKGRTIIATIHQPSSEAFLYFDKLILMMDGHIVYQGGAIESTNHFSDIGLVCPMLVNPTDFFMKILSVNYPKLEEDEAKIKIILNHYEQSLYVPDGLTSARSNAYLQPDLEFYEEQRLGFWSELKVLLWRNAVGFVRDPIHARIKVMQTVFTALLCLAMFRGHESNEFSIQMSLIGSCFFICVDIAMENIMNTVLAFQSERSVFLREQANHMYGVTSYYFARIMIDAPIQTILPLIFSMIIYFKIGLTISVYQFFHFYLALLLLATSCSGVGYCLSTMVTQEEAVVPLSTLIMMPAIQFGGFLVNSGSIPGWLGWLEYLSPIRYALENIARNEFDYRHYDLSKGEVNPLPYLGFDFGSWRCYTFLAVLTLGLRIVSLILLKLFITKFQ
ncbi:hypothetical protein FGO68_gene1560 [Halteria grandinella]|uniref:ABC transporter domain-containing protein n=1 Tax=Halteria grandinella TaxID=5974 RepID=A0A8J8P5R2_HALGN|nr:hypothetical protein FGO68_gene1560 [Halteria grandinella]